MGNTVTYRLKKALIEWLFVSTKVIPVQTILQTWQQGYNLKASAIAYNRFQRFIAADGFQYTLLHWV
jgi:hypothetical protein